MSNKTQNQQGYTLVEVVISITVSIMVIVALTFATISSLRNAQLAKRQAQATKYAQEGLERVRSIRDRNDTITTNFSGVSTFNDLWSIFMSQNCNGTCFFKFQSSTLTSVSNATCTTCTEAINDTNNMGVFKRQIQITDQDCSTTVNCYQIEKQITSIVTWSDFAGEHQSKLATILRKI